MVSKPSVHSSQEDAAAGELRERLMNVGSTLAPNEQAAKSMKPSDGALHDPSLASEALAALDHRAHDAAADAMHAHVKRVALGVVPSVCVQLFGPPLRSADASCDRLDPREHHAERRAVVDVGRGDVRRAERESLPVGDDLVRCTEPRAIRRLFPGGFAPIVLAPTNSRGRLHSSRASWRPGVGRAEVREGDPRHRSATLVLEVHTHTPSSFPLARHGSPARMFG